MYRYSGLNSYLLHSLAQPLIDPSVKMAAKEGKEGFNMLVTECSQSNLSENSSHVSAKT